jgi:hypothetical protein
MRNALLVLALAAAVNAGEPPGDFFENRAFGFKLRVPKDWREVPADHAWIASKHLGKRELDAQRGTLWAREAPELWVTAFPRAPGKVENPYSDYRDFLSKNTQFIDFANGYEIVEEKETTVDGAKVTTYDIKEAKGDRVPHRVIAWVFHYDDFDFAVQFKVFEWSYADYDTSFRGCLKTFKRIDRTEAVAGAADAAGVSAVASRADVLKLPPDQRARAMKDAVEARLRREIEALPDGWKNRRTKKFVVLSAAEDKFTKAAIDHAEAIADHLDDFFGVAGGEYVPPCILRIFATSEEREAYGKGKADAQELVREVAIGAGHGWEKDNAWEDLNRNLWSEWLSMRHPQLEETLPGWFKEGLNKYMNMLRTKGKRIGFANDDWDRDEIRLQIKRGAHEELLALLSRDFTDQGKPNGALEEYDRTRQVRVVVLWLMRQGNSGKSKNLVRDLVLAVASELDAAEAEILKMPEQKDTDRPTLESKRSDIRKAAWNRVFAGWDEGDWNRLTTAWLGYSK